MKRRIGEERREGETEVALIERHPINMKNKRRAIHENSKPE
jgi:hypothetical protein